LASGEGVEESETLFEPPLAENGVLYVPMGYVGVRVCPLIGSARNHKEEKGSA
jgi:hypothetical protein